MKLNYTIWPIIILQTLFGLCASSVIAYRILGIAFDFSFISYRVANIVISIALIVYIIHGLLKHSEKILTWVLLFSAFHFFEGIVIHFWFKVGIHGLVLVIIAIYYGTHKSLNLRAKI